MATSPIKESILNLINKHRKLADYKIGLGVWFDRANTSGPVHFLEVSPKFNYLEMMHSQEDSFGLGAIKMMRHFMVSPEVLEKILADDSDPRYEKLRSLLIPDHEVLYIDPAMLGPRAKRMFWSASVPENLIEAWYLNQEQFVEFRAKSYHPALTTLPQLGLLTLEESPDFVHRKSIVFVHSSSGYLVPVSGNGLSQYSWATRAPDGNYGVFVLVGGRTYKILGFEVVAKPSLSRTLATPNDSDRYVQALLAAT